MVLANPTYSIMLRDDTACRLGHLHHDASNEPGPHLYRMTVPMGSALAPFSHPDAQ